MLDLVDEIHALQKRHASPEEIEAWGDRARSALREYVGDEPEGSVSIN